jgi:hypothetical protein
MAPNRRGAVGSPAFVGEQAGEGLPQLLGRLEPGSAGVLASAGVVDGERISASAIGIQPLHQREPGAWTQRVLVEYGAQVGDRPGPGARVGEPGLGVRLAGCGAQLGEPAARGHQAGVVVEPGQRLPAPQL